MGEALLDLTSLVCDRSELERTFTAKNSFLKRSEEFTLSLSAGEDDKLARCGHKVSIISKTLYFFVRKAAKENRSLGSITVRVCITDVHDGSIEVMIFQDMACITNEYPSRN